MKLNKTISELELKHWISRSSPMCTYTESDPCVILFVFFPLMNMLFGAVKLPCACLSCVQRAGDQTTCDCNEEVVFETLYTENMD